ncbi:type IV secretion system protein VirD4, partial [Pseudonocardia lutea]
MNSLQLLILAASIAVVGAWTWRRRRRVLATLLLAACGFLARDAVMTAPSHAVFLVLASGALLCLIVLSLVAARRSRSASVVTRWGQRARRKAGVASTLDVLRTGSALAVRRRATAVRPSLRIRTHLERARTATTEIAFPLCRVGPLRVWSLLEDVVCVFGGPRTGKTGWLAGRVLDTPGAAVVTSTRTDLLEMTGGLRSRRGPVHVFNAVGLGGIASTVFFDPVSGCQDPIIAAERASDLLGAVYEVGERVSG